MKRRPQNHFMLLTVLSFGFYLSMVALGAGVEAMPWDLADGRGRVFGFNDPMSAEHFRMAMGRVTLIGMAKEAGWYGFVLGVMHLLGLWLIVVPKTTGEFGQRAFFFAQSAVFPLGWLFCFWAPFVFAERIDREFFTDGIPAWMWAQAPWVVLTATIAICWRRFEPSRPEAAESPEPKPI